MDAIRMDANRQVAQRFWKTHAQYPAYPFTRERRFHEVNYLVPKLQGQASLLDLGCGDGSLLHCLMHLTNIETFYGCDMSPELLKRVDPRVKTRVFDCYSPTELPYADVTVIAGVFPFLFESETVLGLLERVSSPLVLIRTPCTLKRSDELVNTFSSQLASQYSAIYRTLTNTIELVNSTHTVEAVDRVYPDEIESAFGTRQFYIKAVKRI